MCCAVASPEAASAPAQAEARAQYEAARGAAGRDPEAHIKLALWCEAHGLQAERIKHLAIAAMADPDNATARGLMGLVAYDGKWQRPESVREKVARDAALKTALEQYQARRAQAPASADGQWKLALWCEENGLKDEARAHLMVVTQIDPRREEAWKRLGYQRHEGRWVSAEQIAAEKAEQAAQKQADKHWKTTLERLRGRLWDKVRKEETEQALSEITDPRAVPMVCQVFGKGSEANQHVAVRLLGQIEGPAASRALGFMAVFSKYVDVRRVASETLVRRDPREFAGMLTALLGDPIKYEVKKVGGPGSPGELLVEGKKFNRKRLYSPPAPPPILPGDRVGYDGSGMPVVMRTIGYFWTPPVRFINPTLPSVGASRPGPMAGRVSAFMGAKGFSQVEAQALGNLLSWQPPLYGPTLLAGSGQVGRPRTGRGVVSYEVPEIAEIPIGRMQIEAEQAAKVAEQQLEGDVAAIKRYNEPIEKLNDRVIAILEKFAGNSLGSDPETWRKWSVDMMGYVYIPQRASQETPTVTEQVPIAFQPQATPILGYGAPVAIRTHTACFGAGTMVATLTGPRPIESIAVGDRVLTQDATSGVLGYHPVVKALHNPPSTTLRLQIGGDSIVATGIHRFWKAGQGWVMARDVKPGDVLRCLGGTGRVSAVETDRVQPVFNLEVAEGQSFFVGTRGVLVHDNSLVEPVAAPFDAAPGLEAVAVAKAP
jgi:hypothetical protein